MTSIPTSRRNMLWLVAVGAAAAASTEDAFAYQGNMERGLASLQDAFASLQAATPNKGGHRERAMRLIEQAMGEVQAGIDFANAHGGGGL